jgi:hypothetical protein
MTRLSFPVRVALTVFLTPFFVGGILLGAIVYSWLIESNGHLSAWWWLLLPCLALVGIASGGLIAYGIIIFFLAWLAPNSLLLVKFEVVNPSIALRILYPTFHAVGKFSRWLAPRPR